MRIGNLEDLETVWESEKTHVAMGDASAVETLQDIEKGTDTPGRGVGAGRSCWASKEALRRLEDSSATIYTARQRGGGGAFDMIAATTDFNGFSSRVASWHPKWLLRHQVVAVNAGGRRCWTGCRRLHHLY